MPPKGKTTCVLLILAVAVCLVPHLISAAQETYRARMLTGRGPIESPVVNLRIEIKDYTIPDEVRKLQDIMSRGGFNAFLNAFRKEEKGSIQVLGSQGLKLRINAVQIKYMDKGHTISLFMEQQNWSTNTKMRVAENFFMVMELDLNEEGEGDGRLYEDAQVLINRDGWFEMAGSNFAPKAIMSVSEVKRKP